MKGWAPDTPIAYRELRESLKGITRSSWSRPAARHGEPSHEGRRGTGRTCGTRSADGRSAGSACSREHRTWACEQPWQSEPSSPSRSRLLEGEAEVTEERAALSVVGRRGDHGDVHAPGTVDLVLVDLVEHDLLRETEGVVATAVELLGGQTTEVADARKRERQGAVQELPHAVATKRDVAADRLTLAQLELRDGLPGLGDGRLLTRDDGQVTDGTVHELRVTGGVADTHVDHDLDEARGLHDVLVGELFLQLACDLLAVLRLETRSGGGSHQMSSPVRLATRILLPSSSKRKPTRVTTLLPSFSTTSWTLETWTGASV